MDGDVCAVLHACDGLVRCLRVLGAHKVVYFHAEPRVVYGVEDVPSFIICIPNARELPFLEPRIR